MDEQSELSTGSEMVYEVSDEDLAELVAAQNEPKIAAKKQRAVQAIFNDAAADAAKNIVDLANNSPNDKVRLDASKYIVERVIGRLGETAIEQANHWETVLAPVYREPSKHELMGPPKPNPGDW